jgi:hypothetical protein
VIHYNYEVAVDPENLVKVRYVDSQGTTVAVVALTCAYVPALGSGSRRQIAIEIVFDPMMQNPAVPYYCDPHQLRQVLVSPRALRGIGPYRV